MGTDQHISILIIEDNAGDQLLLHENLISTSLLISEIIMVETLAEGIAYLNKKNFALVFLDLFLPDSNGLDSLSELLKINSSIPIIISSGLSDSQVALDAITSGAQDFLIKGDYSINLLEKTVRYSIERKHNSDALEKSNMRYTLLSKATHDMVWDWDLATGEVDRNTEGWRKIFRTPEEIEVSPKEDWKTRIHPDSLMKAEKVIADFLASDMQEQFELEIKIIRDDNTIGYIEDRGYIVRDKKGKPVRIIGASHDITERKNAEHKILLREQRFRSLVQNGSDLIGIIDKDGNYFHSGGSIKRILGYEPEYLINKRPFCIIHPEDHNIIEEALLDVKIKSRTKLVPYRYKNASGEWRWMETTFTNLLDDPAVHGIIANSRDITESKLAADEIEKLSRVAKETLSGVYITGADRKIQWVNDAFTKITGFTLEDAIGKKPPELLNGPNRNDEVLAHIDELLSKGLAFEGEKLNYTKCGKPIWVWLQLKPLFNDKGELKQLFGVQTDITEKKLADEELKKLSMVARETINGVIISDKNLNVVWVNNAFIKMYGYQLEEVIGRDPSSFLIGPETDFALVDSVAHQYKQKEAFDFKILCYTKAGNKIYVKIQVQQIFDENGEVKQSFTMHTDITLQKELEEKVEFEKKIKQKEITDAVFAAQERERSEIGREMHDNVNQLLGATRLYIDMARTNEQTRDSLLTTASTYALSAIEEIRKLSKTLITPLINEIGLVDSIADLAQEIMLVHPIQIELTAANFNEEGLSEKFKLNVFRIVQEQINNILKHAKAKKININFKDGSGNILVSITDNGIGFDTAKRKNGVGLTNIKSRSELFNGNVQLTSAQGEGTTLSITFNKSDLLLNGNNQTDQ